eukprot:scaffold20970_cov111-Skeletonema_dohrnii-CCMP3373.AAC.1
MKEEDPHGMPTPLGEAVKITTHADANHANNVATRRSRQHCSHRTVQKKEKKKKQNTVESVTFGAEMAAMRTTRDLN